MLSARFGLLLTLVLSVLTAGSAEDAPVSPADTPTTYALILTGSEILAGQYQDSHLQFLTTTLGPLGCKCETAVFIGDEWQEMEDALRFASERADLVITTGGLGPTDHDITRQVVSKFTGMPLREDPEVIETFKKRYNTQDLRENQRRQALVPEGGSYFPNPNGTAVAPVFDDGKKVIVSLPGPPRELQAMVKDSLVPYLSRRFGTHTIGSSITLRFVGIGESQIAHTLHEKVALPEHLITASFFQSNRVDYTFSLPGHAPEDLARLKQLEKDLLQHIGEFMYSDDGSSLEEVVLRKLAEKNLTLSTAEAGSGGALAAALTSVDLAEKLYRGGHVAPNNQTLMGMLGIASETTDDPSPEERVKQLAQQSCEQSGTDWAMAVTEAQKETDNSRYAWLAVGAKNGGFETHKVPLRGQGEGMHQRFVTDAFDLLRRRLGRIP